MSRIITTVAVTIIAGLLCCSGAAAAKEEEESTSGDIPLYYKQLQDYSSARDVEKPRLWEYCIQPGDNLTEIALRFGTDVETLVDLNMIANPHYIVAGDTIEVITVVGSVHEVSEGETIAAIADLYGVEEEVIISANEFRADQEPGRGERVIVPGGRLSRGNRHPAFCWPMQGTFNSGYGPRGDGFHYGIDIGAPVGTPFYAVAAGTVTHAGWRGAYGIMVEVDHGYGYRTRYGHASDVAVETGQSVSQGEELGYVGLTGNTTGPHLHFELHCGAEKVNPLDYLD
jgi:murein DD-endopeptidase MepM/ murein hydrolase activator NlpD